MAVQAVAFDSLAFYVANSAGGPVFSLGSSPGVMDMYGDAYKNSGGTSWFTFSDQRLKQDVRRYETGLKEILQLRPVRFRYQDDAKRGLTSTHEEIGFIAQEVREVIPDAVSEGDDGYLMLKADPIHWAAINAIQELNKKLEQELKLKTRKIETLERRLEELERRFGQQAAGK
jgi:hypothetical protein